MARTFRNRNQKPYMEEDLFLFRRSGVTLERINARNKGDRRHPDNGIPSYSRKLFNRLHRSKQNQEVRNAVKKQEDPFLPSRFEIGVWWD